MEYWQSVPGFGAPFDPCPSPGPAWREGQGWPDDLMKVGEGL